MLQVLSCAVHRHTVAESTSGLRVFALAHPLTLSDTANLMLCVHLSMLTYHWFLLPPCTCLTLPCSALKSTLSMFNYDKGITPCDELLHLVSDLCDAMNVFHSVKFFFSFSIDETHPSMYGHVLGLFSAVARAHSMATRLDGDHQLP